MWLYCRFIWPSLKRTLVRDGHQRDSSRRLPRFGGGLKECGISYQGYCAVIIVAESTSLLKRNPNANFKTRTDLPSLILALQKLKKKE